MQIDITTDRHNKKIYSFLLFIKRLRPTQNSDKWTGQFCVQEENWLTPGFHSQCREGFTGRGRDFQKTISSLICPLRWPQLKCKQGRKSRAPDDKWKLYNRWDQIHSLLSYNRGTSWQGYFKTDPGITSFHSPCSQTANICSNKSDSLTGIKSYLLSYSKLLFQQ